MGGLCYCHGKCHLIFFQLSQLKNPCNNNHNHVWLLTFFSPPERLGAKNLRRLSGDSSVCADCCPLLHDWWSTWECWGSHWWQTAHRWREARNSFKVHKHILIFLSTLIYIWIQVFSFAISKSFDHPIQSLDCAAYFSLVVKRMWIHPLYNVAARTAQGVSEFYDYDVALVQLTEDVVISTAVRWELLPMLLCLLSSKVCKVRPRHFMEADCFRDPVNWKCSLLGDWQHGATSQNEGILWTVLRCHWKYD